MDKRISEDGKNLRCVNLDWLEVYVLEPRPLDAAYFESRGYRVELRAYGTPQYREMITLYHGKKPLMEIRRDPYSLKSQGGIFEDNSVHLRLPNNMCYSEYPVQFLQGFIKTHGYTYKSTTRLDFCLDFNTFDHGRNVPKFINAYMREKYFKMNQSQVCAHGADSWPIRQYWSLKWGSENSAITTKIYEKTTELMTAQRDKPYIWDAWRDAGLCTEIPVYRVEFSIKGAQVKELYKERHDPKRFVNLDTGEIMHGYIDKSQHVMLDFNAYPTRESMLFTFMALAAKYFDFRESTLTRNGTPQRRDRCPRCELFDISADQRAYRPIRTTQTPQPGRTEKILAKRLIAMFEDSEHYSEKFREYCKIIGAQLMLERDYKRHGIEFPQSELKLTAPRATFTKAQFAEYMQENKRTNEEFAERWLKRREQAEREHYRNQEKILITEKILNRLFDDRFDRRRDDAFAIIKAALDNLPKDKMYNEFGELPF